MTQIIITVLAYKFMTSKIKIGDSINKQLKHWNVINTFQLGLLKNRSCQILFCFLNEFTSLADKSSIINVTPSDVCKAFDLLLQDIFIKKSSI